jgi:hypothetical protein
MSVNLKKLDIGELGPRITIFGVGGVVQAVEEDKTSSPKRWRITMRD